MSEGFTDRTLYSVQAYRGIAALLVVLFHTTQFVSHKYGVAPLGGFFFFGFAGLHLFFVLSGYIIYVIHRPDIGRPGRVLNFARKRLVRIYPTYWAILAIYAISPLLQGKLDFSGLFRNAALFGEMPHRFVVPTAWTLWHEMTFYAFFGLMILAGRRGYLLLAAWFIVIVLVQVFSLNTRFPVATHPFDLLFFMGLAIAALSFRLRRSRHGSRVATALCAGGALGFGILGLYSGSESSPEQVVPWDTWPYILGFGLASTLLLAAPLSDRVEGFFSRRKGLLFLGDASYSIYLIHYPLVKLLVTWTRNIPGVRGSHSQWIADLGLLLVTGIILILGGLFYRKVEAPMLAFLRKRTSGLGQRTLI